MPELKDLKPENFKIVPVKRGCAGCVFLKRSTDEICIITRDLDILDLAIDIDKHFGVSCCGSGIIYKLKDE